MMFDVLSSTTISLTIYIKQEYLRVTNLSLMHSWQRILTPYFMKIPPILITPLHFRFEMPLTSFLPCFLDITYDRATSSMLI